MEPTEQNLPGHEQADLTPTEDTNAPTPNTQPVTPQPAFTDGDLAALTSPHQIPWKPADYALMGVMGEAARKLHDSAVAPIVAAARGYEIIKNESKNNARKKYGLSNWNSGQGRRLSKALSEGDALIMPWYRADLALGHQNDHSATTMPRPSTVQYRPDVPQIVQGDKGKTREAKYEFVVGEDSIIGLHPSTPYEWTVLDENNRTRSDVWMIAEGLLKADSVVSALLLASPSINNDELLLTEADTGLAATRRLTEMMQRLEREYRIPVLCVAGVYNWANSGEWNAFNLKDKEVWIAFDADLASNINVWEATRRIRNFITDKKKAKVKLLSPVVVSGDSGETSKMGVDDYLSKVGDWKGLLRYLTDQFPERPSTDDIGAPGEWRVDKDGCGVSELVEEKDNAGSVIGHHWVPRVALGGRVAELSKRRTPTAQEIETGVLGSGVNEHDTSLEVEVRIEVQWRDSTDDAVKIHSIVGPSTILNYPPEQWDRHGAKIPSEVLMHPEWPPARGKAAIQSWLGAVKANRADERSEPTVWRRMGWVPVGDSSTIPSFVVGDQVISHCGADTVTSPGISEEDLPRSSNFGVGPLVHPEQTFDDVPENAEYRAKVDADLRELFARMINDEPWTNPGVAGAIICAGLRPAIPERPKGTLFIVGPPGKGKSFTAGIFMGFWSARPGVWGSDDLPGSASDTSAAMELAMSRAPVWVIDDYHPSRDGREASGMEDKINAAVRRQFNNAVRRRSNASMGAVAVHSPNTSLVITGENELSVNSIKQRLIEIPLRAGALNRSPDVTNRLEKMSERDGVPARVTQHLIRFIQYTAAVKGNWASVVDLVREDIKHGEDRFVEIMEKDIVASKKRSAELFADYYVVLQWLDRMTAALGWTSGERKMFKLRKEDLGYQMGLMIRQQNTEMAHETPGAALVQAINDLLSANRAHIVDLTDPSNPPSDPRYGGTDLALQLGWTITGNPDNPWRPGGAKIGYLSTIRGTDELLLILDPRNAFTEAQRYFSNLIPAGQTSKSSWQSVKDEGLIADDRRLPQPRTSGGYTARFQIRGANSEEVRGVTGVPVLLEKVLSSGAPDKEDDLSDPTR